MTIEHTSVSPEHNTTGPDCGCACHHQPTSAAAYLTEAELVTELLGTVSPGTLRNWRSRRYGPRYVRAGRKVLYPRSAVDAYLRQIAEEGERRWNDKD